MFLLLLCGLPLLTILLTLFIVIRDRWQSVEWNGVGESGPPRLVVVTGANGGIGFALTEMLLERKGTRVVMACRSLQRAEAARQLLIKKYMGEEKIEIEQIDLLNLSSVAACAKSIASKHAHVDVLVANAGAFASSEKTKDGIEGTLQANYLGHFLLCESLLKHGVTLGRVVLTSSVAHKFAFSASLDDSFSLDIINYCRAKLAEVCYGRVLSERGIPSYSAHPGIVSTNMVQGTFLEFVLKYLQPLMNAMMKSPRQGAQTLLMLSLASHNRLVPGGFYSECALDTTSPLVTPANWRAIHARSLELVASHL